ncbi:hypothetical protein AVEN_201018-1 [Araneus ventricosus]|uniref:Uncharacterized protein n=1 Tax=Araneus ventricosus TaxID=182803 RepID=A0A4Y2K9L3_ARAVE|nr:hypothetical protein AVEN_201018-1 [Araneus ventricosus]
MCFVRLKNGSKQNLEKGSGTLSRVVKVLRKNLTSDILMSEKPSYSFHFLKPFTYHLPSNLLALGVFQVKHHPYRGRREGGIWMANDEPHLTTAYRDTFPRLPSRLAFAARCREIPREEVV